MADQSCFATSSEESKNNVMVYLDDSVGSASGEASVAIFQTSGICFRYEAPNSTESKRI